mmetsp:Transcript_11709/g.29222  ORF Transcript_11709/g.29222 Transcript_11709/m.29222 type:complete len:350 (+) Transcript_11709:143-1192(+)
MKIHLNLAQSYHDYHTGTGSTDHSPQQEQNSTIPMCHRGSCGALILYKTNKHNKSTRSNKACFSSFFPYDTKQFFLRAVTLEKQWCLGQFHHAGGGHRVGIIVVVVTSLVGPQGRPLGGGDRVGVIVVVVTSLVGGQPHPDGGRGVRVGPVVVRRRLVGPQPHGRGDRIRVVVIVVTAPGGPQEHPWRDGRAGGRGDGGGGLWCGGGVHSGHEGEEKHKAQHFWGRRSWVQQFFLHPPSPEIRSGPPRSTGPSCPGFSSWCFRLSGRPMSSLSRATAVTNGTLPRARTPRRRARASSTTPLPTSAGASTAPMTHPTAPRTCLLRTKRPALSRDGLVSQPGLGGADAAPA